MKTITLQISYSHYHPAYQHSYSTRISGTDSMHSRFDNLFLSLSEVVELIKDFRNTRPIWVSGNYPHNRLFNYRYQVNWDFKSIDKLEFYPRVG